MVYDFSCKGRDEKKKSDLQLKKKNKDSKNLLNVLLFFYKFAEDNLP